MRPDITNYTFLRDLSPQAPLPDGHDFRAGLETLRIQFVRADIVRLRVSRGGQFDPHPSEAVCVDWETQPATQFQSKITDTHAHLSTDQLSVELSLNNAHLKITRNDGSVVLESETNPSGQSLFYGALNNDFLLTRKTRFNDSIFGLGEKTGRGDRRGRAFTLWNTDILSPTAKGTVNLHPVPESVDDPRGTAFDPYYVSIPFYYQLDGVSGTASGHFIDNPQRGHFDFCEGNTQYILFEGGHYDEYVFCGPDIPQILEGFTWLTGRMPPPPLWALGHHQCRWANYTADDFRELARQYRSRGIPCDSLWFDINYMRDFQIFTWDREKIPNPEGLLKELREEGFHSVTIIDPGVSAQKGYAVYDEGVQKDYFCRTESGSLFTGKVWPGHTVFPDFPREDVSHWWAQLNASHLAKGLSGIWNDMNEPASSEISVDPMRFKNGTVAHSRYHNEYGTLMSRATHEAFSEALPDQRPFVLSRAGSAGIQRYSALWTGDNCSRWSHLAMSIPMLGGLGVCGQTFVGSDVGGFFENAEPELMLRWVQCAAFYPFFRNHASWGTREQYPWSLGATVENAYREAVQLRYRLLPYLYTQMLLACETGTPLLRPMYYNFQYDAFARSIDDQFCCGPDLLIAPVITAGSTQRQVYLPEGEWVDWHTYAHQSGPCTLRVETPLDSIPIFARAGAVIPLWNEAPACTQSYFPESLTLRVFAPQADGTHSSTLIEDDGISHATLNGKQLRTDFTLTRKGTALHLIGDSTGVGFPEHKRKRFQLEVIHASQTYRTEIASDSKTLDFTLEL